MYIYNDLPNSVHFSTPFLFADDTKCLIGTPYGNSSSDLQKDLDSLYAWSISNCMNLNE